MEVPESGSQGRPRRGHKDITAVLACRYIRLTAGGLMATGFITTPTLYPNGRNNFSSVSSVRLPFPASISVNTRDDTPHHFAYSACDFRVMSRMVFSRSGIS